ncbi:DNA polymerase III subunit gamma and tau [Actinospica robiniae]|uniref:DNA polymerase III subunit gamma and tau n=1 Tax=Actinospica robiniae TaxID=304901 RepID=UPI00040F120F|nr:DNA polymerase III subunit gamma and tau [Actinospica robiniae]
MSLALYRRYRPETFEEVIGQEHVTGPLQQALRNQRVNHAYLFSGPRGCGKTTSARILARCLNCEQGPTPTPCGVCRSCVGLARGAAGSLDVIEIDAASHGGVDDARDLRERAFFAPVESRYKIYILDEAHMVSSAGFNALLKVVEEPPPHLKFIFATTEPEKVIGTIRSRTHHYPFRLVPPGTLRDYLAHLCEQEQIKVEPEVLPLVVRAGAGSVRDSLSVMDQLLAGADENGVSYQAAAALLGYTDSALLDEAVSALAARSGAAAFEIVDRVVEGGHDPRRFLGDLLERLRDLLILQAVPDAAGKGLISVPADRMARMSEQAAGFGQAELSRAADLANTGLTEMRGATAPRLLLELVFARILLPGAEDSARAMATRLERLERFGATAAAAPAGYVPAPGAAAEQPPAQPAAAAPVPAAMAAPAPAPPAPAPPSSTLGAAPWREPAAPAAPAAAAPSAGPAPSASPAPAGDVSAIRARWPEILELVKSQSRVAWTMISANANVVGVEGRVLQIGFNSAGLRDSFAGSNREETLRQVLRQIFGGEWRIDALVDPGAGSGSGQSQGFGPGGGPGHGGPGFGSGGPAAPGPASQGFGSGPAAQNPSAGPASGGFGAPSQNAAPQAAAPASAMPAAGPEARIDGPGTPPTHPPPDRPAPGAPYAAGSAAAPAMPPAPNVSSAVSAATAPPAQSRPPLATAPEPAEEEDPFEAGLVRMDDRAAVSLGPGPSARDLLVRELGANLLEEMQGTD